MNFNNFRDNYPAGFNGIEGEEEETYIFPFHTEVIVDAKSETVAIQRVKKFRLADLDDEYDDELAAGMNRYLIELYGDIEIVSTTIEYAREERRKLTVEEAMEKGLNLN